MNDETENDLSPAALQRFFESNATPSPSPAPSRAPTKPPGNGRSPFSLAMERLLDKRRLTTLAAADQPSNTQTSGTEVQVNPGTDDHITAGFWDDENPIATGKPHRVPDAGPKERKRRREASNVNEQRSRRRVSFAADSEQFAERHEQVAAQNERPVRESEQPAIQNEEIVRQEEQSFTQHEPPARQREQPARRKKQPTARKEQKARQKEQNAGQEESQTEENDTSAFQNQVRERHKQAIIARMRQNRAKTQIPTHFAATFLADSAKQIQQSSRPRQLGKVLPQSENQVRPAPFAHPPRLPPSNPFISPMPLLQAAHKHLDNLTRELRDNESKAWAREEELERMLERAREVRREAAEWRVKGGEQILERRKRLEGLEGLSATELEDVEGWEDLMRPLKLIEVLEDGMVE